MMRMQKNPVLLAVLLQIAALSGCTDNSDHGVCAPGQTATCVCTDGLSGAQVCGPDKTFGACSCTGSGPNSDMSVGGMDAGDLGRADMRATVKRVFVTSTRYSGDLKTAGAGTSGVDGANKLCNLAAQAAAIGGTFKAWVSDTTQNANNAIADVGPWYLIDQQTKVFNDKAQLATTPLHAIDMDETGTSPVSTAVWTGTAVGGTMGGGSCTTWTSGSAGFTGGYGQSSASDSSWTQSGTTICASSYPLYCLEQ